MATKILLVEDEAAIREMVALVLLQQGYDVAEAADYRSAISASGAADTALGAVGLDVTGQIRFAVFAVSQTT